MGGVLVKPLAFDEMATVLTADDFFLPAHREIFLAMMELDQRRQPIDVVSLGDELKSRGALPRLEGGQSYLITLANSVPTAENISHYVRLVKEKATLADRGLCRDPVAGLRRVRQLRGIPRRRRNPDLQGRAAEPARVLSAGERVARRRGQRIANPFHGTPADHRRAHWLHQVG